MGGAALASKTKEASGTVKLLPADPTDAGLTLGGHADCEATVTHRHSTVILMDAEGDPASKSSGDVKDFPHTSQSRNRVDFATVLRGQSRSVREALPSQAGEADYPDGRFGWAIVAAVFLTFFFMSGIQGSFGVFQRYYVYSNRYPGASNLQIAFVGGVGNAMFPIATPFAAKFSNRFGFRLTQQIGATIVVAGLVLASFSTQLWHLFVTQGFMFGLGYGFIFSPALSILAQWFLVKRGTAMGVSQAGGGLGGLAISNLTQYLIDRYGIEWTLRILGIAAGGTCFLTAFLFVERFRSTGRKGLGFDLSYFKDLNFVLLFIGGFCGPWGYFAPFYYIPSYAQLRLGLSPATSALLVSLISALNALGRIVMGVLSDVTGPTNTYAICLILSSLLMYVVWPFASSFGVLLLFVVTFGLASGGFTSVIPLVVGRALGSANFNEKYGLIGSSWAVGLLFGAPVAGVLIDNATVFGPNGERLSADFTPMIMYAASMMMLGAVFVVLLRFRLSKGNLWLRL